LQGKNQYDTIEHSRRQSAKVERTEGRLGIRKQGRLTGLSGGFEEREEAKSAQEKIEKRAQKNEGRVKESAHEA